LVEVSGSRGHPPTIRAGADPDLKAALDKIAEAFAERLREEDEGRG
jgi:hypothetical protein